MDLNPLDDLFDAFDAFEAFDYTEEQLQAFDNFEKKHHSNSNNVPSSIPELPSALTMPSNINSLPQPLACDSQMQNMQVNSGNPIEEPLTRSHHDSSAVNEMSEHYLEHDMFIGGTNSLPGGNPMLDHSGDDQAPPKRGRGRPKGSQNRKTIERLAAQAEAEGPFKEKRPPGRPRGSGPKQLAKAIEATDGGERRRVGRPRKPYPTFGEPKQPMTSQGLRVPGLSATGPSYRRNVAGTSAEPGAHEPAIRKSAVSVSSLEQVNSPPPYTNLEDRATSGQGRPANIHSNGFDIPFTHDDDLGKSASAPEPEPSLAPETDPSHIVEDSLSSDDEDDETRLMEDGLGDDDDGDGEEDGDDEGDEGDGRGRRRHGIPPLHPLPTWLKEVFDACIEQSKIRGLPPLYRDHKTFWFPRPANYFKLDDQELSPQKLYDYDIFLWDPMALLGKEGIPCPNVGCKGRLWRLGHIPRPRRIVGINKSFWIIGYRYRCKLCTSPNSITFRSWDSRILAVLPRPLAAEFLARLTYRSGLALDALAFMRSCFQHGMGAKQVSNALRVQHLQNYDRIHLQYLHTLAIRPLDGSGQFNTAKFKAFLPFESRSPDGLHGFVPGAQWLRDIYDQFIEEHQHEFNQHTAMLTAKICAIDHSFKLTKHVAKVDGVQIFTALLTIMNENGQMRICNLVATKSHSQFILALQRMHHSLELYGHDQPFIFFTDGMNDKDFLEKCFPSLQQDLVPVEKYSHLAPLQIPSNFSISVKNSVTSINDTMRTILELLPEDDGSETVTIGLDAEWNVEVSEHGYVTGRGQTAILQVAHGTNIYILQVGSMLAAQELPLLLKQVLTNPKIRKVGSGVTADLKYLQQACQSNVPFVGGINLGMFAKDRFAVKSARVGLADLCAVVLQKRLNKNVPERVSTAWEDAELTPAQLQYAALDVYASLEIFRALDHIPLPTPLPENVEAGTPVLLFNNDRTRLLARRAVSAHTSDSAFDGINITNTRCVVEVQEILVPGAIITNGTSRKQALEEHGMPPFDIVCLRSHLRQTTVNASTFSLDTRTDDIIDSDHVAEPATTSRYSLEDAVNVPLSEVDGDESSRIGAMLLETLQSDTAHIASAVDDHVPDPASQLEGEAVLHETKSTWVPHIRSRVLKDPFHVFNMFYISAGHGLLREFAIALRDAIFIPDQSDKSRIIAWAQNQRPPKAWNDLLFRHASWLWRRCKRIIPPAEELYPLVAKVFQTYGPLKDAKSGLPLFNTAAWGVAKNVLELIRKGFLSDPPGIPLYYQVGIDSKTGLPLYRCMRGTNMTEGGVHTHLRSRLPTSGVSVRHVQSCLLDFILRHNLLVGTYNTTGQRYTGHYSIWITNELQEMLCLVQHMLIQPRMITNWVNGNLYHPTKEVAGVLPIPDDIRSKSGMGAYFESLHSKQTHHFLASMQGTRKPVLPVHNSEERDLFRELMSGNPAFNDAMSASNCDRAVQLWNNRADSSDSVSYKLAEQLRVYYNGDWKRNANIKQTKAMTADSRVPLTKSLRDPQRSLDAPPVPQSSRALPIASKGLISLPLSPGPHPIPSHMPSMSHSTPPTTSGASGSSQALATDSSLDNSIFELARKRASKSIPDGPIKKRQRRTCRKCAQPTCPGSQKVQNCKNKCRDCGKVNCRGRNSGRPTKTCQTGWDDPE